MPIDARTQVTGLFGYPVEHSLSPAMHNAAFEALGLNFCYLAFSVPPASLEGAIQCVRVLGFRGVNVTVPHKERVLPLLDEVDDEAAFIGAVNTVVNDGGRLRGYNTDGRGFMKSLEDKGIRADGKEIFVVGAGGASRAICYYLAQVADKMHLCDIDRQKASDLIRDLKRFNDSIFFTEEKVKLTTCDMVINATPLGLNMDDRLPFETDGLFPGQIVVDLIYRDTPLLSRAREKGCLTVSGLGMLLWQGALAFELWTGKSAPVEIMRDALTKGMKKA